MRPVLNFLARLRGWAATQRHCLFPSADPLAQEIGDIAYVDPVFVTLLHAPQHGRSALQCLADPPGTDGQLTAKVCTK